MKIERNAIMTPLAKGGAIMTPLAKGNPIWEKAHQAAMNHREIEINDQNKAVDVARNFVDVLASVQIELKLPPYAKETYEVFKSDVIRQQRQALEDRRDKFREEAYEFLHNADDEVFLDAMMTLVKLCAIYTVGRETERAAEIAGLSTDQALIRIYCAQGAVNAPLSSPNVHLGSFVRAEEEQSLV